MKILIYGKDGQVGSDLVEELCKSNVLYSYNKSDLDITDSKKVKKIINKIMPDVLINASAFTNVDECEDKIDFAYNVNAKALETIAKETSRINCLLVHFSTDYVFDGKKKMPYLETDTPNPLNIYAKSKLIGEKNIINNNEKYLIFRVGWIYSHHSKNFLTTILKNAQEKNELYIVNNQIGTPTNSLFIVKNIKKILKNYNKNKEKFKYGLYNLSPEGETTWYDYTKFIIQKSIDLDFDIKCNLNRIFGIKANDLSLLAKRPEYSKLDSTLIKKTFNLKFNKWQNDVYKTLQLLKNVK